MEAAEAGVEVAKIAGIGEGIKGETDAKRPSRMRLRLLILSLTLILFLNVACVNSSGTGGALTLLNPIPMMLILMTFKIISKKINKKNSLFLMVFL